METSEVISFLSKHQSLIVTAITSAVVFSKFITKNILNIKTKSDRKKSIASDLEIANYLVDPKIESHLVNQMAFEALTGKKASLETMQWIFKCHDPSTALDIYANAPQLLKIEKHSLSKAKWIKKYSQLIYWLTFVVSIIILILVSLFTFYSIEILVETSTKLKQSGFGDEFKYIIAYAIIISFLLFDIIGLLWIANMLSSFGIFVAKVERFYRDIEPYIITAK